MLVHFTTARLALVKDIDTLRRIIDVINDKHELIRDWISPAYEKMKRSTGPRKNLSEIYHQSMEEVTKADVFIAEVTYSSFGVGYQVAMAVQQKKPTLLLSREGIENDSIVKGLDDAVVRFEEYNDNNLETIVENFLAENDVQLKSLRFNFFIDRQIYNYLRWASYKTGKTKARILRELVEQEIKKEE